MQLDSITDPYSLCIISYALVLAKSSKANLALSKRDALAIVESKCCKFVNGNSSLSLTTNVPSRARVVRRAHTRKLGAHINVPTKNVFANISYTSFQVQMSSGKMLHKINFMCTQILKKLHGTLLTTDKRKGLQNYSLHQVYIIFT